MAKMVIVLYLLSSVCISSQLSVFPPTRYKINNTMEPKVNGVYIYNGHKALSDTLKEYLKQMQPYTIISQFKNTKHCVVLYLIQQQQQIAWLLWRTVTKYHANQLPSLPFLPKRLTEGMLFLSITSSITDIPTQWTINRWNNPHITVSIRPTELMIPIEPGLDGLSQSGFSDSWGYFDTPIRDDNNQSDTIFLTPYTPMKQPQTNTSVDILSKPCSTLPEISNDTNATLSDITHEVNHTTLYRDDIIAVNIPIAQDQADITTNLDTIALLLSILLRWKDRLVKISYYIGIIGFMLVLYLLTIACLCRRRKKEVYQLKTFDMRQLDVSINVESVLNKKRMRRVQRDKEQIVLDVEGEETIVNRWRPEKFTDALANADVADQAIMDDIVNEMETDEGFKWDNFEHNGMAIDIDDEELDGYNECTQ